jgi:HK97 gp10 family phage protein
MPIWSNIDEEYRKFKARADKIPNAIDQTVGTNAKIVLKESIVQIDDLIYSQPQSPSGYERTKNLRRSNKISKLSYATWLVYNDAEYAGYVHDGTSAMPARPWMQNAIDNKQAEMSKNLEDVGVRIFSGEELARIDLSMEDITGG